MFQRLWKGVCRPVGVASSYKHSLARSMASSSSPCPSELTPLKGVMLMEKLHYLLFFREMFEMDMIDNHIRKHGDYDDMSSWKSKVGSSSFGQALVYNNDSLNLKRAPVCYIVKIFKDMSEHELCFGSWEDKYKRFENEFGSIALDLKKVIEEMISMDKLLTDYEKRDLFEYLDFAKTSNEDRKIANFLMDRVLQRKKDLLDNDENVTEEDQRLMGRALKLGKVLM